MPADHGSGQTNGGFAALVNSVIDGKKSKGENDSSESQQTIDKKPSKGLPSTGLKKNTLEWQESNGSANGNGTAQGSSRVSVSRQSSASSIPSDAEGSEDSRTKAERARDQEGPKGNGPGRHEPDIRLNDGPIHDSPQSGHDDLPLIPPPRGSAGDGAATPVPPEYFRDNAQEDIPDRSTQQSTSSKSNGDENGKGKGKAVDTNDNSDGANVAQEEGASSTDAFDPEERVLSHDSEPNRKMTDEAGRYPDGLVGVKGENPPGSQNDIILGPRLPQIHYHKLHHDESGKRDPHAPILVVTADGESEHPPGQTPKPSRQPSSVQTGMQPSKSTSSGPAASDDEFTSQLKHDLHNMPNGHWSTAVDGSTRPKPKARFSSFRDKDAAPPSSNRHSHYSLHSLHSHKEQPQPQQSGDSHTSTQQQQPPLTQTPQAASRSNSQEEVKQHAHQAWSHLRSKVLPSRHQSESGPAPGPGKVSATASTTITSVPITTELLAGQLPVMMLKTWLDRDEDGRKAVPVLLGNMRFRVGDSVGLREGSATGREMFKVECEYGDGAVKWVIYRELRDFLSLHAHYRAANFGTSVGGLRGSRKVDIPEFPKTSIPYLKSLQRSNQGEKRPHSKADYAQASRDALQHYLVDLIRAVIFRPESNRLCKFFELSSLTLSLAPRGGFQGKAGYIRLPGSNTSRRSNQPGMSPLSWITDRTPKWFTVRDSYFVATEGPESTEFYEVFLLDQDFAIERPKRAYRTGIHFMTGKGSLRAHKEDGDTVANAIHPEHQDVIDADHPFAQEMVIQSGEGKGDAADQLHDDKEHHASQHTFFIQNSQRKLKLVTKNARQMHQFIVSMERIAAQSAWTHQNRFDSFAPLRVNVAAQWLVDGRDYFWNLSRAINMAKDRIYIHDWWISPELYLRRPGDERYRLDNLLKRKAEDGVKIFIIVYNEVSDKTTPVDSTYAKRTLVGLHPNIMMQRSPSHFQTGTFYWSHHEKMCVIDETIAFMGGLDLCYGRWDTSQHVLIDEDHTAPDGPDGPVWRGKDYSNERVVEYFNLDKPFEDMIDRTKVPRMPWHDVGMQIVGQPARDICRHFVQRWNLLIRTKNHKRRLPFLIPAADFTERELHDLQLQGTCEVQICRSVGPWSMGTLTKIEHSVQNAYVKSIELSEHFVYIENQFFITSTVVDGVPIQNGIGDAIVDRVIRAHKEGTKWRACIVIPLLPGYTYPIDSGEASSVRLIMECQNRTISRGSRSIFSRLRKEGIDPEEYITFFSLRGWGKFKSGVLTTEQVYIHGKTCIIDDRLVLCGSANINERSQRGDRDSELLSVIRDTDMIDGTMAGKPFKVGRFAHTLRIRLMREHVGVDVDSIEEDQLMSRQPVADSDDIETWDPDHEQDRSNDDHRSGVTSIKRRTARERLMRTVNTGMGQVTKGLSENAKGKMSKAADKVIYPFQVATGHNTIATSRSDKTDPAERQDFDAEGNAQRGFADSLVPTLEEKTIFERRPSATHRNGQPLFDLVEEGGGASGGEQSASQSHDHSHGHDSGHKGGGQPREAMVPGDDKEANASVDPEIKDGKTGVPKVRGEPDDREMFGAPANAHENDDEPPTKDRHPASEDDEAGYKPSRKEEEAVKARQVLRKHLGAKVGLSPWSMPTPTPKINPNRFHDPLDETFWKDMWVAVAVHNTEIFRKVFRCIPDDLVTSWAQYKAFTSHAEKFNKAPEDVVSKGGDEPVKVVHGGPGTHGAGGGGSGGGVVGAGGDGDKAGSGSGGGGDGEKSDTRHSDIVNGEPKDYGRYRDTDRMRQGIKEQQQGGDERASGARSPSGVDPGEKERRVPSGSEHGFHQWEIDEMEELLKEVRGTLVMYSTRFLEAEDLANNFLFNSDKILPLPIFD